MDSFFGGLSASRLPPSADAAVQLESLLAASDLSDVHSLHRLLQTLSSTHLLRHLGSEQSQHKLTVRINSLIAAQKAAGYRLASLWLTQSPSAWNERLVNHAASWLNHAFNLLSSPATRARPNAELLDAALSLVGTHILIEPSPARQEFHRQVVQPSLIKFVTALVDATSDVVDKLDIGAHGRALLVLVAAIDQHLRAHPASCRAVSARIYTLVRRLLYTSEQVRATAPAGAATFQLPQPLLVACVRLMSSLHLTGALAAKSSEGGGGGNASSRVTQVQMWQSTIAGELATAKQAWAAATSSYDLGDSHSTGAADAESSSSATLPALPTDPLLATQVALGRLELLLGGRGRVGVLPLLLRIPTPRPVPVPFGALLDFALSMLRVGVDTAQRPTAESSLCALQAAHLPQHHLAAMTLVAQLALLAPEAAALQASEVLSELCRIAEAASSSASAAAAAYRPRLRMAAFRTMLSLVGSSERGARVALDPNGRQTLRLARLCASQVANVVLAPAGGIDSHMDATTVDGANGTGSGSGSRRAKKARLYESDSVFGASANPRDAIQRLSPEEVAATQAALEVLCSVFPHLTTELSAQHHDLAHTSAQVVMALVEVLSSTSSHSSSSTFRAATTTEGGAPTIDDLFCTTLQTLSAILRASSSSILALSLPLLTPVLVEVSVSARSGPLRSAANEAINILYHSRRGKMVPIARGVGFYPDATTSTNPEFDPTPEGSQLVPGSDRTLPLEPVGNATSSIRNVLKLAEPLASSSSLSSSSQQGANVDSQGRMDVEAITAESDSLASASASTSAVATITNKEDGVTTAGSPFTAANTTVTGPGSGMGKGLPPQAPPHSPPRPSNLRDSRVFSPDPIKPSHRPSTPRIGSPGRTASFGSPTSAPPTATAVGGGTTASSTLLESSLESKGDGIATTVMQRSGGDEVLLPREGEGEEGMRLSVAQEVGQSIPPPSPPAAAVAAAGDASTGAGAASQPLFRATNDDDDDDDDEEMPAIDMESSGDEDDEDEEDEGGEGGEGTEP